VQEARASEEANRARVLADTLISEQQKDLAIRRAQFKTDQDREQALADSAFAIQQQLQQKVINENEVDAQIARAEREQKLRAQQIDLRQKELEASVIKVADAAKYEKERAAEAELFQARAQADAKRYAAEQDAAAAKARLIAEAQGEKEKLLAQAEGEKAILLAQAEGTRAKAEAMKLMGEAAVLEMAFQVLPEVARNIAERFNGIYGDTFTLPEPFFGKVGSRIMSLQNPRQKMSKSDPNPRASISILDTPDQVMKKCKSAVTDSEADVRFAEGKDGINNLMTIYSACTGKGFDEIEGEFQGRGYGDFKTAVGEAVIEALRGFQEEYRRLVADPAYLKQAAAEGAQAAGRLASRTTQKAMKKVGLWMP